MCLWTSDRTAKHGLGRFSYKLSDVFQLRGVRFEINNDHAREVRQILARGMAATYDVFNILRQLTTQAPQDVFVR